MIDRWSTLRSGAWAGWSLAVVGGSAAATPPPSAARSGAAALSAAPAELDESLLAPALQPASSIPVRNMELTMYRGLTRMVFSDPRSGVHLGRTAHRTRFRQTAY